MMKILFSPSESKIQGGVDGKIEANSFIFADLFEFRLKAIFAYKNFINKADDDSLKKLFGVSNLKAINRYKNGAFDMKFLKAVQRYDGVAYGYLKYALLGEKAQKYIDKNVIIFSNLFGPILAGDKAIFDYKIQQGQSIDELVFALRFIQNFIKFQNLTRL